MGGTGHQSQNDGGRSPAYDIVFFIARWPPRWRSAERSRTPLPAEQYGMSSQAYFVVQQACRGWSRLAYPLVVELITMAGGRGGALPAVGPGAVLDLHLPRKRCDPELDGRAGRLAALRQRWEYSHTAGAAFQALAMSFLILAALARAAERALRA